MVWLYPITTKKNIQILEAVQKGQPGLLIMTTLTFQCYSHDATFRIVYIRRMERVTKMTLVLKTLNIACIVSVTCIASD